MNQQEQIYQQTRAQLLPSLAWNSTVNHQRIWSMFRDDVCVSALPHYVPGTPALVLGSGPTLDAIMPKLASWSGVIFASASQLNIMRHWGIQPQFISLVDSRESAVPYLKEYLDTRCALLTHPGVSPKVLEAWNGRFAFYKLGFEGEWSLMQDFVYPWIHSKVVASGCVVNTTIQLAAELGCSPILLAGVDLAFIDGRNRATDYSFNGQYLDAPLPPETRQAKDQEPEMEFYHTMLLALWKTKKMHLFQIEPHTHALLRELPQIKLEDFPNVPKNKYLVADDIDKVVDRSLQKVGVYVHPPVDGSAQIEYLQSSE